MNASPIWYGKDERVYIPLQHGFQTVHFALVDGAVVSVTRRKRHLLVQGNHSLVIDPLERDRFNIRAKEA